MKTLLARLAVGLVAGVLVLVGATAGADAAFRGQATSAMDVATASLSAPDVVLSDTRCTFLLRDLSTTVTWPAVPNATSYRLTVEGGDAILLEKNFTAGTSYDYFHNGSILKPRTTFRFTVEAKVSTWTSEKTVSTTC
jgi:hypothetical protein